MNHLPHSLARTIEQEKDRIFKPSFWFLYRIEAGGTLAILLILLAIPGLLSFPATWDTLLITLVLTLLVALPITGALVNLMRVEASTDIIASTDYWGRRYSLTWAEIETVESVSVWGLPYYKVESFKSRRALYIPRYLADNEAFREKVIRTASPVNPLRIALEDRTGKASRARANN